MSDGNLRYKVYSGKMLVARCGDADDAVHVAGRTIWPVIKIGRRVIWDYKTDGSELTVDRDAATVYSRANGGGA